MVEQRWPPEFDSLLWECVACLPIVSGVSEGLHRTWIRNSKGGVVEIVTSRMVRNGEFMKVVVG